MLIASKPNALVFVFRLALGFLSRFVKARLFAIYSKVPKAIHHAYLDVRSTWTLRIYDERVAVSHLLG